MSPIATHNPGFAFDLPDDSIMHDASRFRFGVATAAYQVEGAERDDGRTPSIWDIFSREPGRTYQGHTGATACDHYHRWSDDLDLIASLGFDCYRFSISWPRVLPARDTVNEAGLAFYERIVDGLIERGIEPVITLYHWDLPQYLDERGGWCNRETAYAFAEFAALIARRFGNRVKRFITLNEPWCSAFLGYWYGVHAPGLCDPKLAYQAAHHLLLAHGLAMPRLRERAPNAELGIVLNVTPNYPATESADDRLIAELRDDIHTHWFAAPILAGHYPQSVIDRFPERVPAIYPGDLDCIAQRLDFLGINYYSRCVVAHEPGGQARVIEPPPERTTSIGWEIYPDGLHDVLVGLHRRYTVPEIIVTENGAASLDDDGAAPFTDDERCRYFQSHLRAVDRALRAGVNVSGYYAWSLMDNFEWAEGYRQRFGLVHVDFKNQQRAVKKSGAAFQKFLQNRR